MKRLAGFLIALILAILLCWRFPPFRVVPLKQALQEKEDTVFNPRAFVEAFWEDRLLKSLNQAVSVEVLMPAIQADAASAKQKYSRSLGIGESYTYFVAGTGRVLEVGEDEITLAVTPGSTEAEIALETGLIFGNAVRDGTGLLDVNSFPNSQDFNSISEALNLTIEERVLPPLRERAKPGATIRFVGCAEVNDETTDLKPLRVVPIQTSAE